MAHCFDLTFAVLLTRRAFRRRVLSLLFAPGANALLARLQSRYSSLKESTTKQLF